MSRKALLPLQLECTLFFQSNPFRTESIEELEVLFNTERKKLVPTLELLESQGIIENIGDENQAKYRYKEPVIVTEIEKREAR